MLTSVGQGAKDGRSYNAEWRDNCLASIVYLLPLLGKQRCWRVEKSRTSKETDACGRACDLVGWRTGLSERGWDTLQAYLRDMQKQ